MLADVFWFCSSPFSTSCCQEGESDLSLLLRGGARHLGEAIDAGVPTRGVLACEDRGESRMSPKRLLSSSVAAPRTLVLITYSLHHS